MAVSTFKHSGGAIYKAAQWLGNNAADCVTVAKLAGGQFGSQNGAIVVVTGNDTRKVSLGSWLIYTPLGQIVLAPSDYFADTSVWTAQ
jgi:hypothetical protein